MRDESVECEEPIEYLTECIRNGAGDVFGIGGFLSFEEGRQLLKSDECLVTIEF